MEKLKQKRSPWPFYAQQKIKLKQKCEPRNELKEQKNEHKNEHKNEPEKPIKIARSTNSLFNTSPRGQTAHTLITVDFATETCTHVCGRVELLCDCMDLGCLSERVQKMQRNGQASVCYGILDFDFLVA
jgi:hypothetical protein